MLSLLRYVSRELAARYDDRLWWKDRLVQRVVRPVHRSYPGERDALVVMEADWDVLVVLDACRADLFEAVADIDAFDEYSRATSGGSMTAEWTEQNFTNGEFGDTVYVSANPYVSTLAGDAFHELVEVWRDAFDETEGTVPAEAVVDAAIDADTRHPDKRLIVHFMQPHYPFVGHDSLRFASWSPTEIIDGDYGDRPHDPWQALEMGLVERDHVLEAYADNLQYALEHVTPLIDELTGRTVVTSDHGNLLGERLWPVPIRVYGHPIGIRHPALVAVPWAVVDGPRRTVTDEGVTAVAIADDTTVDDRLRALGYR